MKCNECGHLLPEDSEFCQYCGAKIEEIALDESHPQEIKNVVPNESLNQVHMEKRVQTKQPSAPVYTPKPAAKKPTNPKVPMIEMIFNIASLFVVVLASCLIIAAMNIQDIMRDQLLDFPPSLIYGLLLAMNVASGILTLLANFKKHYHKHWIFTSVTAALALIQFIIVTNKEGIIWSIQSSKKMEFINSTLVNTLNSSIEFLFLSLLFLSLILIVYLIFSRVIIHRWHASIEYRERCYKKVEKMFNYYQAGIITEEEYEKAKQDITKNIH